MKGSSNLNDFRPISLLGWIHKLVTKVLFRPISLRLTVIDQLINHTQTAFIQGQGIYDGWVVVSRILDVLKRNKERLIFKLNFEKAYNCVKWLFLLFILRKMNFRDHWIN